MAHHSERIVRGIDNGRKSGCRRDDSLVIPLVRHVGGVSVDGVAGSHSPTVRTETFVVLRISDAISTVHESQITHFIEIAGAVFIF